MFKFLYAVTYLTLLLYIVELTAICQYQQQYAFSQFQTPSYIAESAASSVGAEAEIPNYIKAPHTHYGVHNTFPNNIFKTYYASRPSEKPTPRCAVPPTNCANNSNVYYRSFDGSCNNLQYPGYGMAITRYTRLLAPNYGDGVYSPTVSVVGGRAPLPNARLLSLSLYGGESVPDSLRTLASVQWGQIIAHDITLFKNHGAPDDCCENVDNKLCYPIKLHPNGPITTGSGKECLNFARSTSDADAICGKSGLPYSEKLSFVTAYLDLSSIYGNSLEASQKTRSFKNGLLKTSWVNNRHWLPISLNTDGECGEDKSQCYNIPDMRNQFIPTAAIMHTILLREHNRIATALAQLNPHYTDDRLFQEARKINIAQFQKITFYDWLPLLVGPSFAYATNLIHYVQSNEYVHDYDPTVNPAPYSEYAAAGFRYAHNQIPGWFSLVTPNRDYNQTLRLSDYFERPENINFILNGDNFDSLVRGMATQAQKRADSNLDKEIQHHFNRKETEEFGTDLKAVDIQRARDYGLPSYNSMRQFCGLPRATVWSGFLDVISPDKIAVMQKLYASPDDVDLSIGGSLETHAPEAILGPTFQCIVGKQFLKTRTGDRFFFEREDPYSGFSREQLTEIRKASLSGLFCKNADYLQLIQQNSFIVPNTRNILRSCNTIPQVDLSKWQSVQQTHIY